MFVEYLPYARLISDSTISAWKKLVMFGRKIEIKHTMSNIMKEKDGYSMSMYLGPNLLGASGKDEKKKSDNSAKDHENNALWAM